MNYSAQAHSHSEYVEWCNYRHCAAKLKRQRIANGKGSSNGKGSWSKPGVFELGCHIAATVSAILSLAACFWRKAVSPVDQSSPPIVYNPTLAKNETAWCPGDTQYYATSVVQKDGIVYQQPCNQKLYHDWVGVLNCS